jgi:hypothetical protein
VAEFSKDFDINGKQFTIELAYKGLDSLKLTARHVWIFRLVSDGLVLTAGPFHWSVSERDLTMENVANHLASFYGYGDLERLEGEARLEAAVDMQDSNSGLALRIRSIIWEKFYGDSLVRVRFDQVKLLSMTMAGENWTAMVGVDRDLEKNIYKLEFDAKANEVRIDVFDWMRSHTIAI